MTIRQTALLTVVANAILFLLSISVFLLGISLFLVLLAFQGFVSVIALGILYYWIAQLETDFDKEREST